MAMQIRAHCLVLMCGAALMASCTPTLGQSRNASDAQNTAALLAKTQLASELQLAVADIETLSSESQTWPDSSLGCGKPGTMAAQVLSEGYAVILKTARGTYRVHVAGSNAVNCGPATQWQSRSITRGGNAQREPGAPIRNLNEMIDKARTDLAAKLGVPESQVRMMNFSPKQWPDSSLGCPVVGETITQQSQRGYVIALRKAERTYTYHTDLTRVRACPAIEVE
jgi:hypothetical protein